MTHEEIYDLLHLRLRLYWRMLDSDQQTEFDATLWALAQELIEKTVAPAAN